MKLKLLVTVTMIGLILNIAVAKKINLNNTSSDAEHSPISVTVQPKAADDDQPVAFAVNVKGVINNGVYDPYNSYVHELHDFDNPTLIRKLPRSNLRPYSMAWSADGTVLYGVSREDEKALFTIDPDTAVSTRVGTFSGLGNNQFITGMAIDRNNTCYVVTTDNQNHDTVSTLYRCNLGTGALSLIGSQAVAPDIHDIVASCDGQLYGVDSNSASIVSLEPADGSANIIGGVGLNEDYDIFNLTYDRQNNDLYMYVLHESGFHTGFGKTNHINGASTIISEFFKFGIFVGAIQSTCSDEPESFKLNAHFGGAWYNPETSGQGFFFDVLPESNAMFAGWFTFDDVVGDSINDSILGNSDHRWFTLQGQLGEINTIDLTIVNTEGGRFDDPQDVNSEAVGDVTIEFINCTEAMVSYTMNGSYVGEIPIQRIAGDAVMACEEELLNSNQN